MRFFPENLTFLGVPGGVRFDDRYTCHQRGTSIALRAGDMLLSLGLTAQCNGNRFLHAISRNLGVKTGQNTCPGTPPYRPIYAYIRGLGSKKIVSKE